MAALDDRRPTAQQLAELIELVRRDIRSPAALQLAYAYLALGRPYDAIATLEPHLAAAPNAPLDGRVMIARAYADLHQWREAQGELLRVVKVDRSSRQAFSLLGEVLMRRDDFERAVPVLQHAQQLDPTSPHVLAMLRRAHAGQRLDPPPPQPQPLPPLGESGHMAASFGSPASASMQMQAQMPMQSQPARPKNATQPPPPQLPPTERPRVIPKDKVQNAAAASLRQSAAVGEAYLSELLHGGLLDVAGVRVPDMDYDLRPDRRWGRSTRRAFFLLVMMVVIGATGGGTWLWWSDKQKSEAIPRANDDAMASIATGELEVMRAGAKKLADARDKDASNLLTQAYLAEVSGLEALLYGVPQAADDASAAIAACGQGLAAGDPGEHELAVAKSALALARLRDATTPAAVSAAKLDLADAAKRLDDMLAKADGDKWLHWLRGRAHLAAGERKLARAQWKTASAGDDALIPALVDLADLEASDGDLADALALDDRALKKVADHPLAQLSRALVRAEANVASDDVIGDIRVKLDPNNDKDVKAKLDKDVTDFGPRVVAYRELAYALAYWGIDACDKAADYEKRAKQRSINEPAFWNGLAWLDAQRGAFAEADAARAKAITFGTGRPDDDQVAQAVDVEHALATGRPDRALEAAANLGGTRGRMLRAMALFDLGKPKEALVEAQELAKLTTKKVDKPDPNDPPLPSLDGGMLVAEGKMMLSDTPDKDGTGKAMQGVALARQNKLGTHAYAMAYRSHALYDDARQNFKAAVEDPDSVEAPNPIVERSLTWYADVLVEVARAEATKDSADAQEALATAKTSLDKAAARNGAYLPIGAVRAKLALYQGDVEGASKLLEPLMKDLGSLYPTVSLTWAEVLATRQAADKDKAQHILETLKDKVPPLQLGRVAGLVDPKLPEALGVTDPNAKPVAPAPPPPRGRRR